MENKQQVINIYRTRKYIMTQDIYFNDCIDGSDVLFSKDTYCLRNKKFYKQYVEQFKYRKYIKGKSAQTTVYTRKYFE